MPTSSQLALIHVAKKQLGLDEGEYRAILDRVAGVASSRELSRQSFDSLLVEFKRLGFHQEGRDGVPRGAGQGSDDNRPTKPQWRLLGDLARQAGFESFEDPRFVNWQKSRSGVEHPRFLDMHGLNKLIAALKNWHGRGRNGKTPSTTRTKPKTEMI